MERRALQKLISLSEEEGAFVVHGLSGTGKSFLLRKLTEVYGKRGRYILSDIAIDRELRDCLLSAAASEAPDSVIAALAEYFSMDRERILDTFFLFDGAESLGDSVSLLLGKHLPKRTAWATNRIDRVSAEVRCCEVKPLSFVEFLSEIGHPEYADMIASHVEGNHPIPDLFSQEFDDLYYDYLLTGGFPQAVETYLRDRTDISALRLTHAQIYANIACRLSEELPSDIKLSRLQALFKYYAGSSDVFHPGSIHRGMTRKDFAKEHRYLVQNGFLLPVATMREDAGAKSTTDVDNYSLTDCGLYRFLQNDYDSFYNTDREEMPYSVLRNALYCACHSSDTPVVRWESSRNLRLPLLLSESRIFVTFTSEQTRRSRAAGAFKALRPDWENYHITDVKAKEKGPDHKIQWFEFEQTLMSKKR